SRRLDVEQLSLQAACKAWAPQACRDQPSHSCLSSKLELVHGALRHQLDEVSSILSGSVVIGEQALFGYLGVGYGARIPPLVQEGLKLTGPIGTRSRPRDRHPGAACVLRYKDADNSEA